MATPLTVTCIRKSAQKSTLQACIRSCLRTYPGLGCRVSWVDVATLSLGRLRLQLRRLVFGRVEVDGLWVALIGS